MCKFISPVQFANIIAAFVVCIMSIIYFPLNINIDFFIMLSFISFLSILGIRILSNQKYSLLLIITNALIVFYSSTYVLLFLVLVFIINLLIDVVRNKHSSIIVCDDLIILSHSILKTFLLSLVVVCLKNYWDFNYEIWYLVCIYIVSILIGLYFDLNTDRQITLELLYDEKIFLFFFYSVFGSIVFVYAYKDYGVLYLLLLITFMIPYQRLAVFRKLYEEERRKSNIDELTKLFNRRYLDKIINQNINNNTSFTFIMIDLNNFKHINDFYGHVVGDKILKNYAKHIQSSIRGTDLAFRYGGDEFAILISNSLSPKILNNIIERLSSHDCKINSKHFTIKASVGYQYCDKNDKHTAKNIINIADKKMYEIKKSKSF